MFINDKFVGYIYKIINKINNKYYIGQTRQSVEMRWKHHIINSRAEQTRSLIDQAIKKYGAEHFIVTIIEEVICETYEELKNKLNNLEKKYILELKSSYRYNNYNITNGGEKVSPICYTHIDQYDLSGNFIAEYKSIIDATNSLKLNEKSGANISSCCNGKRRTAYGFIWRYHGEPFDKYHIYTQHMDKIPIDEYDLYGNLINQYSDIYEISGSDSLKIRGYIYRVCRGERPQYKNRIYRYKNDPFDKFNSKKYARRNSPYNCYDLNNNFIKTYNNATEAAMKLNENCYKSVRSCIWLCAKGKLNSCYNYKWFYADDPNQPDKSKIIVA